MSDLRFPIGPFQFVDELSPEARDAAILAIEQTPAKLKAALAGLTPAQLDTPYRPEGWTVRQVAHHLVDSHMNSYVRFKLALTEENPTIKPYDEKQWAEFEDAKLWPVEDSVRMLEMLHKKLVATLRAMRPEDFRRTFFHPEHNRSFTLDTALGIYSWHGPHHVAHITALRDRMGWKAAPAAEKKAGGAVKKAAAKAKAKPVKRKTAKKTAMKKAKPAAKKSKSKIKSKSKKRK